MLVVGSRRGHGRILRSGAGALIKVHSRTGGAFLNQFYPMQVVFVAETEETRVHVLSGVKE